MYGAIERIRIVKDKKGKSKSYAFIVFDRERDMKGESPTPGCVARYFSRAWSLIMFATRFVSPAHSRLQGRRRYPDPPQKDPRRRRTRTDRQGLETP